MEKRNSFRGTFGFIMAAAGSAVGLGNIWRFPYLAARDGGGLFLVVYLILAVSFGFALLTAEITLGRKTRQSPLTAYGALKKRWKFIGLFSCMVPMIILPYYCAIGGWVIKYFLVYITGDGVAAAEDSYFTGYITSQSSPIILMVIFLVIVSVVVIAGVDKGIESFSKILMPVLVVLVIFIAIFSLTINYTDAEGVTRTGLQGLKIMVVPDVTDLTIKQFFNTLVDAMGQLFFSLSVAMGIMIAYGSYVPKEANLSKSIDYIEIFDVAIAFLAGVMIIPAVYVFQGQQGLDSSGPGLMFVSLPKVFAQMGGFGRFIGILFFAMVLFAALTSAVSIMEAVVSSFMDQFHLTRKKASVLEAVIALIGGLLVCLGYNKLYFEVTLPNGSVGQLLDILDYISNNVFMPLIGILTCILIGWVTSPKVIIEEIECNGNKMGRKKLFIVMIKFICPVLLIILLLKSVGVLKMI